MLRANSPTEAMAMVTSAISMSTDATPPIADGNTLLPLIDVEEIRRFLTEEESSFEGELPPFPIHSTITASADKSSSMSAPGLVEMELRATRDHLAKLRFNWHEMKTKSLFLTLLTDGEEWRACQSTKWTPGELKQVEAVEVASHKAQLQQLKQQTADWQLTLAQAADTVATLQPLVRRKGAQLQSMLAEWEHQIKERNSVLAGLPSVESFVLPETIRSVDELQTMLDEQEMAMEKRTSAVERQRSALLDLERRLALYQGELERLQTATADLEVERDKKLRPPSLGEAQLSQLCNWYVGLRDLLEELTSWKVELVQVDYLVATYGGMTPTTTIMSTPTKTTTNPSIAVHIYVEPSTGRLKQVRVGTTSNTPRRQWREIVDAAIEYNDIPFLLRSIQGALFKSQSSSP